ncbi:hypothetical protein EC957_003942 [Mortierella hygrophila]|uniref:Uncharacterized protein n=1 Tax=Mortierella hygrophila TaxID=979708 RepID=A0A9P6K0V2_9FUNG|nr:hypothetical protein EC957_003942 [Mortierella hygrophila]
MCFMIPGRRLPFSSLLKAALEGSQCLQAQPSNVPAHLIHAAGTTKAPTLTPKPKAAAVPKYAPSAPQQVHRQTHPEDTDHFAHPTPKEKIAHQQHVENRHRRPYPPPTQTSPQPPR